MTRSFAQALRDAPALEELSIHCQDVFDLTWGVDLLHFLNNKNLQTTWARSHLEPIKARLDTLQAGVSRRIVDKLTFVWHEYELE